MSEVWFYMPIVVIVGIVVMLSIVAAFGVQYVDFVSSQVEIEQLRSDVTKVAVASSEDVVGQVTAWNQKIVAKQRWNRVPVACLFIPNGWDRISVIEVKP